MKQFFLLSEKNYSQPEFLDNYTKMEFGDQTKHA